MKRPRSPMMDVTAALTGRGQTPLYRWLWDRYDELPPYERYKVNLVKLTAALNELAVRGRDEDKPLNTGIVRKTYERVRSDRARLLSKAETAKGDPPQPRAQSPAPVRIEMIEPDIPPPAKTRRSFPMSSPPKKEL